MIHIRSAKNLSKPSSAPLTDDDLLDLLYGLGLTASGGGGGYTLGQAIVNGIIRDVPVANRVLTRVNELSNDDFAVMVGGIGAPSVITPATILNFAQYAAFGIKQYNADQSTAITAILPVEAGPVNALLAFYIGWTLGLKVVNCDGASRAVPSLTNLGYNYSGAPISPVYLAGVIDGQLQANQVLPAPQDAAAAEAAIRDNLGKYGDAAALLCWGQYGQQLIPSPNIVIDIFDRVMKIGKMLRRVRKDPDIFKGTLIMHPEYFPSIFECKLRAVQQDPEPGYDDGFLFFVGKELFTGKPESLFAIQFENENMVLREGGEIETITAPSIMAMLFQTDDGYVPLNNGDDLPNQNVIDKPAFVLIMQPSCLLYNGALLPSFINVLAAAPFNFSGNIHPRRCWSGPSLG